MSSMNKVILIGNLGRDPEVRSLGSGGGKVANLSIATSETWKDKNSGDRKEKTEWHNVVVFGDGLVGIIEKYLSKGSKVAIEGKLQTRKWQDKDGNDRWSTEVVVQGFGGSLVMLSGKSDGGSSGGGYGGSRSQEDAPSGGGYSSDMDDEIPF